MYTHIVANEQFPLIHLSIPLNQQKNETFSICDITKESHHHYRCNDMKNASKLFFCQIMALKCLKKKILNEDRKTVRAVSLFLYSSRINSTIILTRLYFYFLSHTMCSLTFSCSFSISHWISRHSVGVLSLLLNTF